MGLREVLSKTKDEVIRRITLTEKEECLKQIQKILSKFEMESNIPNNHDYWHLKNRYRIL